MILREASLAILLVGGLALVALVAAAPHAIAVLRHWDTASGSALQLKLERRTALVSAGVALALVAQCAGLLLFVFNADRLAPSFVGAMCAVGTLQVNRWGFPALWGGIAMLFLSAMWLTLNAVDVRSPDYPLTRAKHGVLLAALPLSALSFGLASAHLAGLRADVITSCCGSLFSAAADPAPGELSGVLIDAPVTVAMPVFFAGLAIAVALAFAVARRGRGGALLGVAGIAAFALGLWAIVAFISPYVYEDPRHRCPFCLLKAEYGYQGYVLYLPLFGATASALGALALAPFARRPRLGVAVAATTRRLARVAGILYLAFGLVAALVIAGSRLVLVGHAAG